MTINDFRVQPATAIPPVEPISTRKGTTFRAPIFDAFGAQRLVYLKLLKIEDIAREALCAVLARMVALPIAQAFYVYVDPAYVPGQVSGNIYNYGFGLERDYFPAFRIADDQIHDEIRSWDEAVACGVFDQWIFNEDRLPKNLLRASDGVFWLIDHDEALPNSAGVNEVCDSQILQVLREGKDELDLHRLRRKALNVVERFKEIHWSDVRKFVLQPEVAMSNIDSHIEKYIKFLRQRIEHMPEILTRSLKIKQLDMMLDSRAEPVDWEEKKS